MAHRTGHSRKITDGPHTGIKIECLPDGDIEGPPALPDRGGEWPFEGYDLIPQGIERSRRQEVPSGIAAAGPSSGQNLMPKEPTGVPIGPVDGRIDRLAANGSNIRPNAISLNEWNERECGNLKSMPRTDTDSFSVRVLVHGKPRRAVGMAIGIGLHRNFT
jgi:hypothetical protein